MKFSLWTWYHIFYILSPFLVVALLWLLLRKKSERAKWLVAVALAIINIVILVARNVDIAIAVGRMDSELIPLGPCHFANIIFLIAVITKKQSWYNLAWCLNLPFGLLAMIFADSLSNYPTVLAIRPMAYIWGHFFLMVSVLYVFVAGITKFNKKSFKKSLMYAAVWAVVCIITNVLYNHFSAGNYGTANYMYFVIPEGGTPLEIPHSWGSDYALGNTTVNPIYIVTMLAVGFILFLAMYYLHKGLKRNKIGK